MENYIIAFLSLVCGIAGIYIMVVLKKSPPEDPTPELLSQESLEEFCNRIYREQEEADLKFLDYRIEQNRLKHRFDKLKYPKPKWIHQ